MKRTLLIVLFLFFAKVGFASDIYRREAPLEWKTCAMDADCDAVAVGCWFWVVANKENLKQVEENLGSKSCRASLQPGPKPVAACINQICVNKWTACDQDNECAAAVVRCSMSIKANWKPVNKRYIKEFEKSEREDLKKSGWSCSWGTFQAGLEPNSVCVDKACKLSWKD